MLFSYKERRVLVATEKEVNSWTFLLQLVVGWQRASEQEKGRFIGCKICLMSDGGNIIHEKESIKKEIRLKINLTYHDDFKFPLFMRHIESVYGRKSERKNQVEKMLKGKIWRGQGDTSTMDDIKRKNDTAHTKFIGRRSDEKIKLNIKNVFYHTITTMNHWAFAFWNEHEDVMGIRFRRHWRFAHTSSLFFFRGKTFTFHTRSTFLKLPIKLMRKCFLFWHFYLLYIRICIVQ